MVVLSVSVRSNNGGGGGGHHHGQPFEEPERRPESSRGTRNSRRKAGAGARSGKMMGVNGLACDSKSIDVCRLIRLKSDAIVNSPKTTAAVSPIAARIPRRRLGTSTRMNTLHHPAPSDRAVSLNTTVSIELRLLWMAR